MYYPKDNYKNEPKRDNALFDLTFAFIAILASGFSGYTTYLGFSYDFPVLPSVILAIIIGFSLLMINFKIRNSRRNGDALLGSLFAFLLVLIFSFISNTNAIYTYFVKRDIVEDVNVKAWRTFDEGTSSILSKINSNQEQLKYEEKKRVLDVEVNNLTKQITDPNNPGMGREAKRHYQKIESILGTSLTPLTSPRNRSNMEKYKDYSITLERLIYDQFSSLFNTPTIKSLNTLKRDIVTLRTSYQGNISRKQFSPDEIDRMDKDLRSLGLKLQKITGEIVVLPEINTEQDKTGSFQYTWNNFIDWVRPSAIILTILISLLLDLLVPALSLLLYKNEDVI